jgi:hypothetical protein
MGKVGHLKTQVIVMLVVQTAATAAYAGVVPGNRTGWMALQFFGQGAFALITLLCYVIAGLNVPLRHLGLASGLIGTFRSGGGSVGNAIFNTILNGVVNEQIPKRLAQVAESNSLPLETLGSLIPAAMENALGVPGAFAKVPGITPEIEAMAASAIKEAYAYAFTRVFYASIPFGCLAIIAAFFILDPSKYLTNHTAVKMERQGVMGREKTEEY